MRMRTLSLLIVLLSLLGGLVVPCWGDEMGLYYQANNYYWNREYTSAIEVYRKILRDYPDSAMKPKIYFSLGSSYYELDEYQKAQSWYERLMDNEDIDSSILVDAMFRLGQCYTETGNYQRAGEVLDRLVTEHPSSLVFARASMLLERARAAGYRPGAVAVPAPSPDRAPDRTVPSPEVNGPAQTNEPPRAGFYRVKPGDSLSSIAENELGDVGRYRELALLNDITPPYRIQVGQQLTLPGGTRAAITANAPSEPVVPAPDHPALAVKPPPGPTASHPAESAAVAQLQRVQLVQQRLDEALARIEELEILRSGGPTPAAVIDVTQSERLAELNRENEDLRHQLEAAGLQLNAAQDRFAEMRSDLEQQIADSITVSYTDQLEQLEAALRDERAITEQLHAELSTREELLARTRASFDELHEKYQDVEVVMAQQEDDIQSYHDLNQTLVDKVHGLETAVASLEENLEREQMTADARTRALTESYESRLNELTTQIGDLQMALENQDSQINTLTASRLDMEETINRMARRDEELQEAVPLVDQGRRLRQQGKYEEAIQTYQEALERDPNSADAMNGLAYLYAETGENLEEARDMVKTAMESNPQAKGYYLDTLGWVYYKGGNHGQAIRLFNQALELIPSRDRAARAIVSFHLGLALFDQGDRDKAFFAFVDTITYAPGTEYATQAQTYLGRL